MSYRPRTLVVANEAALAPVISADGVDVFVQSYRTWWTKKNGVVGVTTPPLKANEVIASTDGTGVYVRDVNYSDDFWRIGRDDWFIDPAAGNDENDGATVGTAIKTGTELSRRWGTQNLISQSGASPDFSVHIHIRGDILAPDFLAVDCIVDGQTEILVLGENFASSLPSQATAVTAENQAGNIPWNITSAGAPVVVGSRIRWTDGAAVGAVAWVAKVLAAGNQWRISNTALSTLTSFGIVPVNKAPAANDHFVVDTLWRVNMGIVRVLQQGDVISFGAFVQFTDLQCEGSPGTLHLANAGPSQLNQISNVFYQCRFASELETLAVYYANCGFAATTVFRKPSYVYGGLFYNTTTIVEWQPGEEGQMQNDTYIQGTRGLLCGGMCTIGNLAVFDSAAGGGLAGDGIVVGEPGPITGNTGPAAVKIAGLLWGNGNAGVGLNIRSISRAVYTTVPVITGAGGDFQLAGTVVAGYYFAAATGNYLPFGGQATTWALLAAVKGAPGYGNSAHEPDKDAHLCLFA